MTGLARGDPAASADGIGFGLSQGFPCPQTCSYSSLEASKPDEQPGAVLPRLQVVPLLIFRGALALSPMVATLTPFPPHPRRHVLVDLLRTAVLTGARRYLIMVLICVSLMVSELEHLFIRLLAIDMPSLEKCVFWSPLLFLNLVVRGFFLVLSCMSSL